MPTLPGTLAAWGREDFFGTLQQEIAALGPDALPLDQNFMYGGDVKEGSLTILALQATGGAETIDLRILVLFTEIEPAGCCPYAPGERHGQCELRGIINKRDAMVRFEAITDNQDENT